MKKEKHGQSFILQRITKLLEHISSIVWENYRGLESAPERGVIELTMAKQFYQKVDHFTTWLVGVLQQFWQFSPEDLSQKIFSLLVPGYKVHLQLLLLRFCGSFVLFSIAKRESFVFLGGMSRTVIMWNQCFRKDLHFLFLFVVVDLWICSGTW